MKTIDFLVEHWTGASQAAVTVWLALIARSFQVSLSTHGTRLETHREAIRRARVLWWLKKEDEGQLLTRNGMTDWLAINEVFLSPAAVEAFKSVARWKNDVISNAANGSAHLFPQAEEGLEILSRELLRFRPLTFRESMGEWLRKRRRRRRR